MSLVNESHQIFLDAWQALGKGAPDSLRYATSLIDFAWSGLPSPFLNLALNTNAPASLDHFAAAVAEAVAFATPRNAPWTLGLCQETLGPLFAPASAHLEEHGFAPMMPLTGMEARSLQLPSTSTTLSVLTETDPSAGFAALRINSAAYHVEIGTPGTLPMEQPGWWTPPASFLNVLSKDGQPRSTSAVFNLNGLPYVALVATHPDAQRHGLASLAMAQVLARALAAGLGPRAYLHASAAGRPIYERMGFTPTAEYQLFVKL